MTDLGSPDNPLEMHGEQWVIETRSDDPSSAADDERWIRTDLTEEDDQIGAIKCGDGIVIPIFATGTAEETVREAFRVRVNGQTGYAPIAPVEDSNIPARRIQHDGQLHAFHDRVAPGSAIPDSVVLLPASNSLENFGGDTGGYNVNDEAPVFTHDINNDLSLKTTRAQNDFIGSLNGLNRYPDVGETHRYAVNLSNVNDSRFFAFIAGNSETTRHGYAIDIDVGGDSVRIQRYDNGSFGAGLDDVSNVGLSANEFVEVEILHESNGNITAKIFDDQNTQLSELSGSDSTYINNGLYDNTGIGLQNVGSVSGEVIDFWRIVD